MRMDQTIPCELFAEKSRDVCWAAGLDGRCRYISAACARVLGVGAAEMAGRFLWELPEPEAAATLEDWWKKIRELDGECRMHLSFSDANGLVHMLEMHAWPLRDASGPTTGFQGIIHDHTRTAFMEKLCRQAQYTEALGRLAGGILHDLNNALTTVIGGSTFLLNDLVPGSPSYEDAQQVKAAADRTAALIRQLQGFGKAKPAQHQPVQLNQVLSGLEKMARRLLGDNVAVEFQLAPDLKEISADVGQVEHALLQLLIMVRDALIRAGALIPENPAQPPPQRQYQVRIATQRVQVSSAEDKARPGLHPGAYALAQITAAGAWPMPEALQQADATQTDTLAYRWAQARARVGENQGLAFYQLEQPEACRIELFFPAAAL